MRQYSHVHVFRGGVHLFRLAVADEQASGLIVQAIAARDQLTERARTAEPGFQVQLLGGRMVQCTGHNVNHAIRNAQVLIEFLGVADHFVHHLPGLVVVRRRQHELLDFLELMDAENAAGVTAMGADLLAKARRKAGVSMDAGKMNAIG